MVFLEHGSIDDLYLAMFVFLGVKLNPCNCILACMFCWSLSGLEGFLCYFFLFVLHSKYAYPNEIALHLIHGHSGGSCTGGMWLLPDPKDMSK